MFDGRFEAFHAEVFAASEAVVGGEFLEGVLGDCVEGFTVGFGGGSFDEVVFEFGSDTVGWIIVDWY